MTAYKVRPTKPTTTKPSKSPSSKGFGKKTPRPALRALRAILGTTHCFYCGARFTEPKPANKLVNSSPTVDHVVARSKEGSHEVTNLVPACWGCNHAKAGMPPLAWWADLAENNNYRGGY